MFTNGPEQEHTGRTNQNRLIYSMAAAFLQTKAFDLRPNENQEQSRWQELQQLIFKKSPNLANTLFNPEYLNGPGIYCSLEVLEYLATELQLAPANIFDLLENSVIKSGIENSWLLTPPRNLLQRDIKRIQKVWTFLLNELNMDLSEILELIQVINEKASFDLFINNTTFCLETIRQNIDSGPDKVLKNHLQFMSFLSPLFNMDSVPDEKGTKNNMMVLDFLSFLSKSLFELGNTFSHVCCYPDRTIYNDILTTISESIFLGEFELAKFQLSPAFISSTVYVNETIKSPPVKDLINNKLFGSPESPKKFEESSIRISHDLCLINAGVEIITDTLKKYTLPNKILIF